MMFLKHPYCQECGGIAIGTVDWVPGTARLQVVDGGFEYAGETEMWWDGQVNEHELLNGDSEAVRVTCGEHEWVTEYAEDER